MLTRMSIVACSDGLKIEGDTATHAYGNAALRRADLAAVRGNCQVSCQQLPLPPQQLRQIGAARLLLCLNQKLEKATPVSYFPQNDLYKFLFQAQLLCEQEMIMLCMQV